MVGAASGEFLDVRREEDARNAFLVCVELSDRQELRSIIGLDELPDKHIALYLSLGQSRAQGLSKPCMHVLT